MREPLLRVRQTIEFHLLERTKITLLSLLCFILVATRLGYSFSTTAAAVPLVKPLSPSRPLWKLLEQRSNSMVFLQRVIFCSFQLAAIRISSFIGQPMTISYYIAPRAPRRSVSAPTTTARSLLNRVEKPPLSERLTKEEADVAPPSGP